MYLTENVTFHWEREPNFRTQLCDSYGLNFTGAPVKKPAVASSQISYGCVWGTKATRAHI